ESGGRVLSSALNAIEALRAVGARKVVAANKWNATINRNLAAFLTHFDIELIGTATESQEPVQFQRADLRVGAELAYRLGREAFERTPHADALFIGGGARVADPPPPAPQHQFRQPASTSLNGAVRSILTTLGCWRPFPPGHGRILEAE